jgi:transcriptional regulator with XRE-family HTH domain
MQIRRAEDIASLIRMAREAAKLSQQALADRLGVSRKWVNEIEQSSSNPKIRLVLRALNELGIALSASREAAAAGPPVAEAVDIDAIADMNLSGSAAPKPPRKGARR